MAKQSLSEILAGVSTRRPDITLGTEISLKNVEMYSEVNFKEKEKRKENTFHHHVIENDCVASPLTCPSDTPSAPSERTSSVSRVLGEANREPKFGYKRISREDKYVEINVQVSDYRVGNRFKRINVYVSLKTDTDQSYSVFLSGAGTTSKSELKRGAKDNQTILETINTFHESFENGMIARLHYKAVKGYTTDFHRGLLKSAMICIEEINGVFTAYFYLLGELYHIPLNEELTLKQKKHYIASGVWKDTYNLTDEEEFDV